MNRKIKNIIMIITVIMVCIASGFTIKLAKESGEVKQGNPPQMSNTNGENNGQMGTPPNVNNNSDGNNQGTPPSKPDDSSENASSNTQQSQMMEKTDGQNGQENGNMPSMSGQSNQIETAYYIIFGNVTVDKTGDSDGGDSSNFYGNNSAILAKDGANLTITNTTITTEADGANGGFSYGDSATTNNSSSDGTTATINLTNNTIINK